VKSNHIVFLFVSWVFFAAASTGCGGSTTRPKPAATERKFEGTAMRLAEDPRYGVYTSIPWGFRTASYWIEGPEGLVFIDTQFLPSAATEALDKAEAITGKKVALAIVLHPNPDKFNGTSVFQARGIRVVTSAQVLAKIPSVHADRKESFYDRYKPDYPADAAKPESFGDTAQELSAGGVKVKAHVLGAGCSEAHVVIEHEGHVFVGDLVGNGTHAWLEIGEVEQWQARLAEITALKPRFVHPGRGATGGPELLEWEAGYLRRVLEEVAK
jgi:glyoxylase-like metal-dependent hydrolase (beta-lactamase superfamily II)